MLASHAADFEKKLSLLARSGFCMGYDPSADFQVKRGAGRAVWTVEIRRDIAIVPALSSAAVSTGSSEIDIALPGSTAPSAGTIPIHTETFHRIRIKDDVISHTAELRRTVAGGS